MSNTDLSPSWHRLAGRLLGADESGLPAEAATAGDLFPGRHSNQAEIAAETPIFHALALGRRHGRSEPAPPRRIPAPRTDPLTEFRRNPLTAPIPMQVNSEPLVPLGPQTRRTVPTAPAISLVTSSGAHAQPEPPRRHGRHHRSGR